MGLVIPIVDSNQDLPVLSASAGDCRVALIGRIPGSQPALRTGAFCTQEHAVPNVKVVLRRDVVCLLHGSPLLRFALIGFGKHGLLPGP